MRGAVARGSVGVAGLGVVRGCGVARFGTALGGVPATAARGLIYLGGGALVCPLSDGLADPDAGVLSAGEPSEGEL